MVTTTHDDLIAQKDAHILQLTPAVRKAFRQERATPILEGIFARFEEIRQKTGIQ